MTNEGTQDAEESRTAEKTAETQQEAATQTDAPAAESVSNSEDSAATAAEASSEVELPVSPDAPETNIETDSMPQDAAEHAERSAEPPAAISPPVRTEPRRVKKPVQPVAQAPEPPVSEVPRAPAAQISEAAGDSPQPAGDIDFGAILEQFEQEQTVFSEGELVEGKIVGITDRGILVDFGYKSEGFVPVEEFTGPGGELLAVVGEPVEVIIRIMPSGDGAPQLSRIDALGRKVWDEIETAFNDETPVVGRVVDKTKGGLRIDLNGIEAFLPGSQIDSRPIRGLDSYIGQDIEAQVIKFSRKRNNIVLSRKIITDKVVGAQKAETMSKIEVGFIVDGTIKNLTEYGAFVDIGGIDGLLHVTDMSWGRLHHPGDQFSVAEHIQVKVLKLDREREKISLGFKQLLPDPWSTVVEVYPVNTKMNGTVSSVTDYGVFVELEPGVEGLVHVSEISWSRRAQSPKRIFQKGQQVEVQVLGVDTDEKRISLGMKQFQENPWETVDIRYPVGTKVIGRVRNLTDFGAFVELEEGIDGLVHVSDISWAKKIKHPKDVLKKDQEVEAVVTSIDKRGQRLSLSMKDLTPSAWEGFVATHRPGDVVRGKVSRFTNFGVFVELEEGLEGLCHISELSDERVERPESIAELGQEMDFKILRIEPADQKIGLSHRAVGKQEEPSSADSKMYSTEAKGGMASLGELAKLRRGDAAEELPAQEDPEEKKRAKQAAKKVKADEFAAKEAEAALESEKAQEGVEAVDTADAGDTAAKTQDAAMEAEIDGDGTENETVSPAQEQNSDDIKADSADETSSEPASEEAVEPVKDAETPPEAGAAESGDLSDEEAEAVEKTGEAAYNDDVSKDESKDAAPDSDENVASEKITPDVDDQPAELENAEKTSA